ncbi:acyl-[acyl-carrier-protein] thioesterase [Desulfosarcina ovata]|uniref:Acyl-ACP thioesterase n=2 Tax=Desulfosarcina ovata TaxID=83564 RepID=A0A5K8AKY9_9BACT|nr:acyl-ACP thioesterase domain-containing protein [Desulfosarcina ovata]BBO86327.1 acyl-ACP thioesterase [Desulfosarcina ovata subsp. sediminis]BBO93268.1 acyl-ACP thioesterase [Desulfosarcina ovata subsp. ovata]
MIPKHSAEFSVHLHHLGPDGLARPGVMFDFFQDAASQQTSPLKLSIRHLIERGLTWVVVRYRVRILRYPQWQERIRVTTWRSATHGQRVPREFMVTDTDGRKIALGQGIFMLLDYATRHPVSPEVPLADFPIVDETVFEDDFERLPPVSTPWVPDVNVAVRRDDLDLNHHVNNPRYIAFALESIPDDFRQTHQVKQIEAIFKASIGYGDTLTSRIEKQADEMPTFIHQLTGNCDGHEFCRLLTRWQGIR